MLSLSIHQESANQNHSEILPHRRQNSYYQKEKKDQALVRLWRKENPSALLVGSEIGASTMKNIINAPFLKNRTTI